ncbi:hypothetical protein [Streptomyces zingiberis]|uniref:Tat pathway signal sequence domain protein n=1 Tax=Streptomyces zingiberis TaxID=2053010 RepID=A0ABX1C1P8_9ACTN|nr:hypothetical protein [Streptomyces zingiberis]NJQ01882.1 hypothetical protein [Streptomyces zingiberis]
MASGALRAAAALVVVAGSVLAAPGASGPPSPPPPPAPAAVVVAVPSAVTAGGGAASPVRDSVVAAGAGVPAVAARAEAPVPRGGGRPNTRQIVVSLVLTAGALLGMVVLAVHRHREAGRPTPPDPRRRRTPPPDRS